MQLHVLDREAFRPCQAAAALIAAVRRLWPRNFAWRQPPFEYEEKLLPFDMLSGGASLRLAIEAGRTAADIAAGWEPGCAAFKAETSRFLIYR